MGWIPEPPRQPKSSPFHSAPHQHLPWIAHISLRSVPALGLRRKDLHHTVPRPRLGPTADLGVLSRGAEDGDMKNLGRRSGCINLCVHVWGQSCRWNEAPPPPKPSNLEVFPRVGPSYGLNLKCPQQGHVLKVYSSAGGRRYLGICRPSGEVWLSWWKWVTGEGTLKVPAPAVSPLCHSWCHASK